MIPATMSPEAREAARGVPVWLGAKVVDDDGQGLVTFPPSGSEDDATEVWVAMLWHDGSGGGDSIWGRNTGSDIVDLSDPDTRAAYDRRLALALGAPIEAVDEGVSVCVSGDWITLFAGLTDNADRSDDCPASHPTWESSTIRVRGANGDPLLARALAWPAGKRVTG